MIHKNPSETAIRLMLDVYESILGGGTAHYCSAPVTSGKRYIDWLKRIGKDFADIDAAHEDYRQAHFDEVIGANRVHAQRVIQRLRRELGQVVIDPTALPHIGGWTQQDWRSFWRRVIERYAATAVFVEDWQYSNGCVYEFWVAHKKGIPTLDENRHPLSLAGGIDMITASISELREQNAPTAFIEKTLTDLKSLASVREQPSME